MIITGKGTRVDDQRHEKEIYKVTFVGGIVNFLLLALKFVAGILGHSAAMMADAIHSLSDFLTDFIVVVFVNISHRPEDRLHQYGHGKYETLATVLVGVVLFLVGLGILWNGLTKIYLYFKGEELLTPGMLALWAALVSILLKELTFRYTLKKGRALKSKVVVANAWHHRSDALSSIGTAVGIGGAILLGPQWTILDPLAAVIVSFFILKVSVKLTYPCLGELLEEALPDEVEDDILSIVASFPDVTEPHNLCTRRIGNRYAVEMHIRMDGNISLAQAHMRSTAIEQRIREKYGEDTHVSIHMEPVKCSEQIL